MKKMNFKKFLLLFCVFACMFSLTACSDNISVDKAKETTKEKELAVYTEGFEAWATDMIHFLDQTSDEQIKEYAENSKTLDEVNNTKYCINPEGMNAATVEFYNGWVKTKEDLGKLKSIDKITVEISKDTGTLCTINVNTTYENRTCKYELVVNEKLALESGAINPTYTTGEKMEKAVMNTIIGMGTVFIVLIFISFIISLLKYVNKIGDKSSKEEPKNEAAAGVDNAIAQIVSNEENEADDLELVAVITAAIAAAEGTSSNGLVVRSIRKVKSGSWKNA